MRIKSVYTTVFGPFTTICDSCPALNCILLIRKFQKKQVMEENSNNNGFLNSILTVLNLSLEVVLALIALGFIIGIYGLLS